MANEPNQPDQPEFNEEVFDYDALHVPLDKPVSNFSTFTTLSKGALGTGILALPHAYIDAGIIPGTIMLVVFATLNAYITVNMVRLKHKVCTREKVQCSTISAAMGMGYKYGPKCLKTCHGLGSWGVSITLLLYQIGLLCVYYEFIVENLIQVLLIYNITWSRLSFYLAAFPFFCVLMLLRKPYYLTMGANIAIVGTLVSIFIILGYTFQGSLNTKDAKLVTSGSALLSFLGTALFATNNIAVALTLEDKMKNPQDFKKVYYISTVFIIILCIVFGIICYLKYTTETKGSVTLNLPPEEKWAQTAKIVNSFVVFISYAIQILPAIEIFEMWLPKEQFTPEKCLPDYMLRFAIVVFTLIVAICIPSIGKLISLVGCLCLPLLYYFFPTLLDMCVHYHDSLRKKELHCIKDTCLIAFGIFATVVGTVTTAMQEK